MISISPQARRCGTPARTRTQIPTSVVSCAIQLHHGGLVGRLGFEPRISAFRVRRLTELDHRPMEAALGIEPSHIRVATGPLSHSGSPP